MTTDLIRDAREALDAGDFSRAAALASLAAAEMLARPAAAGAPRLLLPKETGRLLGFKGGTVLNRLVANEGFPAAVLVGGRRVWREDEVAAWIKARPRQQP